MRVAFLTEMGFRGRIPENHPNMRTEFAWMFALQADHFNIHEYPQVKDYDVVFIIFPKGSVRLNTVGLEMTTDMPDKDMSIYLNPVVEVLKQQNKKVCNVQEGPSWFFNEYDLDIQFHFYNKLSECDVLFAHNQSDVLFYKGLFPNKPVNIIPTLMIANSIPTKSSTEEKTIIGGNFCRWYGGFQSFMVAGRFNCPIYVPSSHCKRRGEEQIEGLNHLPWVSWTEWINRLETYKYAVNIMPTVAAGTFSVNCAFWGIPCIGNSEVDTQRNLYPNTSVLLHDINKANEIADMLRNDISFYQKVSEESRNLLRNSYHFDRKLWLSHMERAING